MTQHIQTLVSGIVDQLLDAVCVVDEQGRFLFLSAACEDILGYNQQELLGRPMLELVHPDDRQRTLDAAGEIMNGQPKRHFENRYIRKDGRVIDIMWSARWLEHERVRVAVARDVTVIKRAERVKAAVYKITETAYGVQDLQSIYHSIHKVIAGLLEQCEFSLALLDTANHQLKLVYAGDEQGPQDASVLKLDPAVYQVVASGEPLGRHRQQPGSSIPADCDWIALPLRAQGQVLGALIVSCHNHLLGRDEQQLLQFVCTQVAATIARKQAEEKLVYLASHDILTNLPNRMLFMDRFDMALKQASRAQSRLGLLFFDLDKFKQVNDAFGHDVGDMLLVETSRRLEQAVRSSDTVGRMGGDEFTLLLSFIKDQSDVELVVEKILEAMQTPFILGELQLHMSASIGMAIYPDHGDCKETLLRVADSRMYQAKKART
ncbi:diguanylate cyclase domain-containing protein [Bowmanella denitrificans]|uniref:diguanylate cyclase domain-containing protein n=1 Tax=Bowmanella denitrificans TaxID=366582 RepID=UPI001C0EDB90|nr:diguanylate cyclase [Bowmanella denitrificans]